MKLIKLAAAALLLASGALVACGDGEKGSSADSLKNVKSAQQGDAYATNINIRYVDMDTLLMHYDFCLEQEAKVSQIQLELQQYQNTLARNLQSHQAAIQQKAESHSYLTEASYQADMQELQKLNNVSEAQMSRRVQVDQQRVIELKKAYMDAIDNYIVEYNKAHKYDAILYKNAGLYFNPALDITNEILIGLNDAYKKQKESKKDAAPAEDKK